MIVVGLFTYDANLDINWEAEDERKANRIKLTTQASMSRRNSMGYIYILLYFSCGNTISIFTICIFQVACNSYN